jgi:hypothetical protein
MYDISLYCSYLHFNLIDGVIGGMLASSVVDHRFKAKTLTFLLLR